MPRRILRLVASVSSAVDARTDAVAFRYLFERVSPRMVRADLAVRYPDPPHPTGKTVTGDYRARSLWLQRVARLSHIRLRLVEERSPAPPLDKLDEALLD